MIYQLNMNRVKPRELWEFWVNQYNTYPAHALFGVKESFGRETIKWH
jgi:hypothetical protein